MYGLVEQGFLVHIGTRIRIYLSIMIMSDEDADQTVRMHRLVCTLVVCIQ